MSEEIKKEETKQPPKIGYAYLISFNMYIRIKKPLQPYEDKLIPDAEEMVFFEPLPHSKPAADYIFKLKKKEFARQKLSHPELGERELLSIKVTHVHEWGPVELSPMKEEEPVN